MEILNINKCGISVDIIKYKFKEWNDFHKNNKIVDINNFEIIDNYGDIEFNDIYNEYYNNFLYAIIYNTQLIGFAIIDIRFNSTEIFIKNLLLSNNCDWYNIIYNIIIFYDKNDYISINFCEIMNHHTIINNIMTYFNSVFLKSEYKNDDYYLIKLQNYN
jgi:hypothetical protein